MTLTEISIVYLAVGAPFAAHYLLAHRNERQSAARLWLKAFAVGLLWIFYAANLFGQKFVAARRCANDFARTKANGETAIESIEQRLQAAASCFAAQQNGEFSFFEFRETLARYIGLTLAINNCDVSAPLTKRETEAFSIAQRSTKNAQIGARCVRRRNLRRLEIHQTHAKFDLKRFVDQFAKFASQNDFHELQQDFKRLASILDDREAARLFENVAQIEVAKPHTNVRAVEQTAPKVRKPESAPAIAFPVWQAKRKIMDN